MTGRTVCVNRARTGLWGSRWATTGSTRRRTAEATPSASYPIAISLTAHLSLEDLNSATLSSGALSQFRPPSAFHRIGISDAFC